MLRSLRSQNREASEEEKVVLAELRDGGRLTNLQHAEWHRKCGKEKAQKCSAIISNPFGMIKKLLGQKCSGHLCCPEEEINHFIINTYSDSGREQDLGQCDTLISPPNPPPSLISKNPHSKKEVIKSARITSAPSGAPYKVFTQCPQFWERFWKILKVI